MKVFVIQKRSIFISCCLFIVIAALLSFYFTNVELTHNNYIEDPIRSGDPNKNIMAVTCNVDWGNEVIPDLLKVLEEKNVHITFFITGRWASQNPDLLKLIHSKGHEIGNHAYGHKMHSKISEELNYTEIKKTEEIIYDILGIKCEYFAPPAGDFNEITLNVASRLGYKTVLWSVDTIDWKEDSTSSVIIQRVMKKTHKGAILLMHPRAETIKALPIIIDRVRQNGIEIGTVSTLLE